FRTTQAAGSTDVSFVIPLADGSQATLTVDATSKVARIDAPTDAIPVVRRLVQSLDVARPATDVTDVVTLQNADPALISRAMALAGGKAPSVANERRHIGQFVTMVFQPGANEEEQEDNNRQGRDDQRPPEPQN